MFFFFLFFFFVFPSFFFFFLFFFCIFGFVFFFLGGGVWALYQHRRITLSVNNPITPMSKQQKRGVSMVKL